MLTKARTSSRTHSWADKRGVFICFGSCPAAAEEVIALPTLRRETSQRRAVKSFPFAARSILDQPSPLRALGTVSAADGVLEEIDQIATQRRRRFGAWLV